MHKFVEKPETEEKIVKDNNTMNSEHHTLFKTKMPSSEENLREDLYRKVPEFTQYRFFVDSFMEFGRELHEIYNELWNATPNDKIELRINSRGGFVNEGAQFYSIIKNKFCGRCTTVLDNCGYSMGALTFCMGDKRVAMERSDLMFHDYSGGEYGKGGEMKDSLEHTTKHIRQFFHDVIVDQGFLTEKEFQLMLIGKDFWMDTEELCKRGIATHVLACSEEITAKEFLKNLKKKRKDRKKEGKE